MPNLSNVKAIVGDLLNRQANFGSYNASKAALDKKYVSDYKWSETVDGREYFYNNKGNVLAMDNKGARDYINKKDELAAVAYDSYLEGERAILDNTNKVGVLYCGERDGSDKFTHMLFHVHENFGFEIEDSNHNGIVDEQDTVSINNKGNAEVKTIAEFLGLTQKDK